MNFKFGLNTVVFLSLIIITILIWTGAELVHQSANTEIPADLLEYSNNPIDNTFDAKVLKDLYVGEKAYYESQRNPEQQ